MPLAATISSRCVKARSPSRRRKSSTLRSISSGESAHPGKAARNVQRTRANPTRSAPSSWIRAGRRLLRGLRPSPTFSCSIGWIVLAAIWCCRCRGTMASSAALSHYDRRRGRTRSRFRWRGLFGSKATRFTLSVSTASTTRRSSTSSPILLRPTRCLMPSLAGMRGGQSEPSLAPCQDAGPTNSVWDGFGMTAGTLA